MRTKITILFLFLLLSTGSRELSAHQQEEKSRRFDDEGFEVLNTEPSTEVLEAINKRYVKEIRPIFKQKCFDCHTTATNYPWYYPIPGIKQLIDRDTRKAKKHLDMSNDFPFEGHHGTVIDNLEALERVIRENRMPLWRYRFLHWNTWLSKKEREKILKWIQESQSKIKQ